MTSHAEPGLPTVFRIDSQNMVDMHAILSNVLLSFVHSVLAKRGGVIFISIEFADSKGRPKPTDSFTTRTCHSATYPMFNTQYLESNVTEQKWCRR